MITKFFTNQLESSPKITRFQVDRETETAVYFRRSPHVEIREPKRSSHWNYNGGPNDRRTETEIH